MTAVREQGLYIFYSDLSWQVVYDDLGSGTAVKKEIQKRQLANVTPGLVTLRVDRKDGAYDSRRKEGEKLIFQLRLY